MVAAYDVYVDLKLKTEQGIEFYKKFKKTLVEFNEKMAKFGEEMNEVEFKLQSKAEKCKKYDFKLAFLTIFEGFFSNSSRQTLFAAYSVVCYHR